MTTVIYIYVDVLDQKYLALFQLCPLYSRALLDVVLDVFGLEVFSAVEETKPYVRCVGRRFFDVAVEGCTYGLPIDDLAITRINLLTVDFRGYVHSLEPGPLCEFIVVGVGFLV